MRERMEPAGWSEVGTHRTQTNETQVTQRENKRLEKLNRKKNPQGTQIRTKLHETQKHTRLWGIDITHERNMQIPNAQGKKREQLKAKVQTGLWQFSM